MKITTEKLTIWAKRAIPALALAATAGVMLPGCEKDPIEQKPIYRAPYEKELLFDNYSIDSIKVPVVQKYADDTACKKIYLTTQPRCDFTDGADFIHDMRTMFLQPALDVSPKVTGRGDIYILDAVTCTPMIVYGMFKTDGHFVRDKKNTAHRAVGLSPSVMRCSGRVADGGLYVFTQRCR